MQTSTCLMTPSQQWIRRWGNKFTREWLRNYGSRERQYYWWPIRFPTWKIVTRWWSWRMVKLPIMIRPNNWRKNWGNSRCLKNKVFMKRRRMKKKKYLWRNLKNNHTFWKWIASAIRKSLLRSQWSRRKDPIMTSLNPWKKRRNN